MQLSLDFKVLSFLLNILLSELLCEAEVLADEESKLIPCDCTFPCKYVLYMK